MKVENGFLTAIPEKSEFRPSSAFGTPDPQIKQQLARYAQSIFSRLQLYPLSRVGQPTEPAPPADVLALTADTIAAAIAKLQTWAGCKDCSRVFTNAIPHLSGLAPPATSDPSGFGLEKETPLSGARALPDDSAVLFAVDDRVGVTETVPVSFDFGTVAPHGDGLVLSGMVVSSWIDAGYKGKFWIQKEIREHFETLYQDIGLSPVAIVSLAGRPRSIHITESVRLGRVLVPAGDDGKADPNAARIFYNLLPTKQFQGSKDAKLYPVMLGSSTAFFALCLPEVKNGPAAGGGTCDTRDDQGNDLHLPAGGGQQEKLTYVDTLKLAGQQAALQQLGYSAAPQSEPLAPELLPDFQFRTPPTDLVVQKLGAKTTPASSTPAASTATAPTPPRAAPKEATKTGAFRTPAAPALSGEKLAPAKPDDPPPPALPPSLGDYAIGFQYRPGQAVRVLGAAQLSHLSIAGSPASLSLQAGTDRTHPVAFGNFNVDYLWFDRLRRRLSVQFTASTDATSQRILAGALIDERRTGGDAQADLELFADRGGFRFDLTAEPRRETVSLTRSGQGAGSMNLDTIDTGALLVYGNSAVLRRTHFQLNPHVKTGVGLAGGEPAYLFFGINGGLHQRVSDTLLLSLDAAGAFEAASRRTPIFELPSLGGADTVRGFRTDDALGRRLWSTQIEFWAPLPGTLHATASQGVASYLRKNVRMAAFFDAGGVQDTAISGTPGLPAESGTASSPGTRYGPGLGVRFLQGPIALKFDWAYGFGQGALGSGHGRFYIGVSRNGSF